MGRGGSRVRCVMPHCVPHPLPRPLPCPLPALRQRMQGRPATTPVHLRSAAFTGARLASTAAAAASSTGAKPSIQPSNSTTSTGPATRGQVAGSARSPCPLNADLSYLQGQQGADAQQQQEWRHGSGSTHSDSCTAPAAAAAAAGPDAPRQGYAAARCGGALESTKALCAQRHVMRPRVAPHLQQRVARVLRRHCKGNRGRPNSGWACCDGRDATLWPRNSPHHTTTATHTCLLPRACEVEVVDGAGGGGGACVRKQRLQLLAQRGLAAPLRRGDAQDQRAGAAGGPVLRQLRLAPEEDRQVVLKDAGPAAGDTGRAGG